MKTGIELIAKERQEQIKKHGRTIASDVRHNAFKQLSEAAAVLLADPQHLLYDSDIINGFAPSEWNENAFSKMMDKPYMERLIIAGALIAAEIDRIQHREVSNG